MIPFILLPRRSVALPVRPLGSPLHTIPFSLCYILGHLFLEHGANYRILLHLILLYTTTRHCASPSFQTACQRTGPEGGDDDDNDDALYPSKHATTTGDPVMPCAVSLQVSDATLGLLGGQAGSWDRRLRDYQCFAWYIFGKPKKSRNLGPSQAHEEPVLRIIGHGPARHHILPGAAVARGSAMCLPPSEAAGGL